MKDIVSSLKKSSKYFNKIAQLGKRLITTTTLSKCGFRKERGMPCKTILTDLLMLSFEKKKPVPESRERQRNDRTSQNILSVSRKRKTLMGKAAV